MTRDLLRTMANMPVRGELFPPTEFSGPIDRYSYLANVIIEAIYKIDEWLADRSIHRYHAGDSTLVGRRHQLERMLTALENPYDPQNTRILSWLDAGRII